MTHILAQQLRDRADWLKRERENGGDAEHLWAREQECRHIVTLAESEGERVTAGLNAAVEKHFEKTKTIVEQAMALPPLDDELIWILGRPNFACAQLAQSLRELLEHEIAPKAEHEQAAVIHWMLGIYLEHGPQWRDRAREILREAQATADAQASRVE